MNVKVHNRHLKNARHMIIEPLLMMQSAILERLSHFTGWVHLRVLEKAPTPTIAPAVYRAIMALCRCTDAANDQMLDVFGASEKKGQLVKPPRSYAYLLHL